MRLGTTCRALGRRLLLALHRPGAMGRDELGLRHLLLAWRLIDAGAELLGGRVGRLLGLLGLRATEDQQ
jgi:hypothetical protein